MQPKSANILAFLLLKGWIVTKTTSKYSFLKPPKYFEFDKPDFKIKVPRYDAGKDTPEYLLRLTFHLAKMYDLDKYELLGMLSKDERELKTEIDRQKEILAMKESYLSAIARAS